LSLTAHVAAPATPLRDAIRAGAMSLCVLSVLVLFVPLFAARPANLTSDESLYLAEAHSIARGDGITYPSGEPVVHRAPLFPAALAPFVRAGGPEGAYALTKIVVVANALLVMLLAFRMGGALAGAIAGLTAAGAAYLGGLGTTLYLDPFQCSFLLLALLALLEAARGQRLRWYAAAGALVGVAFLAKESAVQWAPLGALAWLMVPSMRNALGARGALMFTVCFGAAIAPWYAWVWLESGRIFMLGEPTPLVMAMFAAAGLAISAATLAISCWPAVPRAHRDRLRSLAPAFAAAIVVAWGAFMLAGLTRYSEWGYNNDYVSNVPRYLTRIAPEAQPYLLLLSAWAWVAFAAWRRDNGARLIAAAALLFAPFALFIANRDLQLRDALPLIYLSYIALGLAAAWAIRALAATLSHRAAEPLLLGVLAVLGTVFATQQAFVFRNDNEAAASMGVQSASWDSEFVRENATWMTEHLPAGSRVLSSRLYFSSLDVRTDGRFRIHQMPTVRVDITPDRDHLLTPASNLFRWGESDVRPYRRGDDWMYLRRFPGKDYWIGMSQQELMEYIGARRIDYIVLTGDDATFSSLGYASYFTLHPAFTLLYHDEVSPSQQFFVYRVDRSRLGSIDYPLNINPSSFEALQRETGLAPAALEWTLGVRIRVSSMETGISPQEELEAVSGAAP